MQLKTVLSKLDENGLFIYVILNRFIEPIYELDPNEAAAAFKNLITLIPTLKDKFILSSKYENSLERDQLFKGILISLEIIDKNTAINLSLEKFIKNTLKLTACSTDMTISVPSTIASSVNIDYTYTNTDIYKILSARLALHNEYKIEVLTCSVWTGKPSSYDPYFAIEFF